MPYYSDYDDYYYDDDYHTDDSNIYDSDEDIIENELYEDVAYEDPDDMVYKDYDQVPPEWRELHFNTMTIQVSNQGVVKYPDSIFNTTQGIDVVGTPYKMVRIPIYENVYRNYFMHELVWVAFNGDIPYGWEIGHKIKNDNIYNNELSNLDIYKTVVDKGFHSSILI